MEFVNLFVKTEYSMLDSTCAISRLVEKAAKAGSTALAMTDNGNMHGAIKFYEACINNNIKPLIWSGLYSTILFKLFKIFATSIGLYSIDKLFLGP